MKLYVHCTSNNPMKLDYYSPRGVGIATLVDCSKVQLNYKRVISPPPQKQAINNLLSDKSSIWFYLCLHLWERLCVQGKYSVVFIINIHKSSVKWILAEIFWYQLFVSWVTLPSISTNSFSFDGLLLNNNWHYTAIFWLTITLAVELSYTIEDWSCMWFLNCNLENSFPTQLTSIVRVKRKFILNYRENMSNLCLSPHHLQSHAASSEITDCFRDWQTILNWRMGVYKKIFLKH